LAVVPLRRVLLLAVGLWAAVLLLRIRLLLRAVVACGSALRWLLVVLLAAIILVRAGGLLNVAGRGFVVFGSHCVWVLREWLEEDGLLR